MIHSLYSPANYNPPPRSTEWDTNCPFPIGTGLLGLELLWLSKTTLVVHADQDGAITVEYEGEKRVGIFSMHPSACVYTVPLNLNIVLPWGFNGLILPHYNFFAPRPVHTYCDSPAVIPQLLELNWAQKSISLDCSLPLPGTEHIFYAGQPVAQLIPVPRGEIVCRPMDAHELTKMTEAQG